MVHYVIAAVTTVVCATIIATTTIPERDVLITRLALRCMVQDGTFSERGSHAVCTQNPLRGYPGPPHVLFREEIPNRVGAVSSRGTLGSQSGIE